MRKMPLAAIIAAAAISVPVSIQADPVSSFEAQAAVYGLNSGQYTSSYDGYSQIYCIGQAAHTYTSTNIRVRPDASSEKKATIDAGTNVKLWGYTDNGWCYVYFTDENGQAASGYIRVDLLEFQMRQTEEPQTEIQQDGAIQVESIQETPQTEMTAETSQSDDQQIQ